MNKLIQRLKVLNAVAVATYKEWAAYRTHSMVSILVGPLFFVVQMTIWTAVYSGKTDLNGMSLHMMLRYYGISILINYLTMDFADWNLQMLIHTGKYLPFALRPLHHRFFALSQKIGHRVLGFIFEFIPVLAIMVFVFRIDMIPASFFLFVISVVFSFLITFYINYSIGIMAFFMTKTTGIRTAVKLITSLSSGALIPLQFFPKWCQAIFFVLPFQHMIYVPSMVFAGSYQLAGIPLPLPAIVGVQGLFVIVMFAFSEMLYRLGNKHFTGVGA